MTASLYARHVRDRFARSLVGNREPGRLWRVNRDALAVENETFPINVIAVPSEDIFVTTINLPLPSHRQRVEALPFAIEDYLGEPISTLHLALGTQVAPRRYLVAAVRHDVMRLWMDLIQASNIERAAVVPDALLLRIPPEGNWRMHLSEGRAQVRSSDGAGFAVPTERLSAAWNAAGRPLLLASGDPVSADMMPSVVAIEYEWLAGDAPLDMAQGRYMMRRRVVVPAVGRRVLQVAALGVAAHSAIAIADTLVLREIAARRAQETRSLATSILPGIGLDDDLVGVVASKLPTARRHASDNFLETLDRISVALAPSNSIKFSAVRYDGAAKIIVLDVASGDEQGLARQLAAAGLNVSTGPNSVRVRIGTA